jgi:hypothetical protein
MSKLTSPIGAGSARRSYSGQSRQRRGTLRLSARIGADHLGHTRISMTQDRYMARGRVHTAVADLLDRTINDE